mgnify:CR=1 FL=1
MLTENSKKIVLKLGSSTVVDNKGAFKKKWVTSLIKDIKKYGKNKNFVIVSSGAIALGQKYLKIKIRAWDGNGNYFGEKYPKYLDETIGQLFENPSEISSITIYIEPSNTKVLEYSNKNLIPIQEIQSKQDKQLIQSLTAKVKE